MSADERAQRRARADLVERDGMQVLIDYMHIGVYGPGCPPEVRERRDAMMARAPVADAAAALRGRAERPDYRPRLERPDLPAFVCTGPRTRGPRGRHRRDRRALQRPELVVVDGAGHLPNLEAEDVFNAALAAFLTSAKLLVQRS